MLIPCKPGFVSRSGRGAALSLGVSLFALTLAVASCAEEGEGDEDVRQLDEADGDERFPSPSSLGCNPLYNDCPPGTGCHDLGGDPRFSCVELDDSASVGVAGDACRFATDCQVGLVCTLRVADEACRDGGFGCCTPVCDLGDADTQCPASTLCVPYFDQPPPGAETLGLCAL